MNFRGWRALIFERFPPASYGPLIVVFCLANISYEHNLLDLGWKTLLFSLLIAFSLFLRLRLFDELKDLETDRQVNPTRPLARGAIDPEEVKVGIFILIAVEGLLFATLAPLAMGYWLASLAYSLLMYNEFFLSQFIRPRLTTYAVSHTFVSVLMGMALFAFSSANQITLEKRHFVFFLGNWFLFNLFEFARKSFVPSEEKTNVESYSKLFGIWGAAALSLSQAVLFVILLPLGFDRPLASQELRVAYGLCAVYSLFCALFTLKPEISNAKLFRNFTGVLLLLFYLWSIVANQVGVHL